MIEIFGGDDHITNKVSYYANAINENYMQYVKVDTQLREKLKQAINEEHDEKPPKR
tara:strand:+ start:838 stop:1005 length:168 start_codon:yes stop_codon:yes gene_type:complete